MGFPVLHRPSSFMHAVAITPARSLGAHFAHFPSDGSLTRTDNGSALALGFPRFAQRLLTLQPACSPSRLHDPLHQRLQLLRYLHNCSGCFRLEQKLPGGICTRRKTVPLHGARQSFPRACYALLDRCDGPLAGAAIQRRPPCPPWRSWPTCRHRSSRREIGQCSNAHFSPHRTYIESRILTKPRTGYGRHATIAMESEGHPLPQPQQSIIENVRRNTEHRVATKWLRTT
jgi:hypothetical protein